RQCLEVETLALGLVCEARYRQVQDLALTRIHVAQTQPLGSFDTWRQALPITLLDVVKPLDA
ncbi:MAG: hypothetical protein ACLGJA_25000, partial [Gammaproteobacteria bacterium]